MIARFSTGTVPGPRVSKSWKIGRAELGRSDILKGIPLPSESKETSCSGGSTDRTVDRGEEDQRQEKK